MQTDEVIRTGLTVVIAAAAVYIAARQWLTAKAKLKLDLYDRRFKIYSSTLDMIHAIRNETEKEKLVKRVTDYAEMMIQAKFLLPDRLLAYLSELESKAVDYTRAKKKFERGLASSEAEFLVLADSENELDAYFRLQNDRLEKEFMVVLSFKEVL